MAIQSHPGIAAFLKGHQVTPKGGLRAPAI